MPTRAGLAGLGLGGDDGPVADGRGDHVADAGDVVRLDRAEPAFP